MRRTNWKTVSTLVTMIVLASCTERIAAPAASTTVARSLAPGAPALSLNTDASTSTSASFTVSPSGGVFFIGTNAVIFPKGSICDPATSSYGMGTWDNACTPLASSITVTATTKVQDGRTWIDFSPALRFVPSTDPSRYVWMYMYTPAATSSSDLSRFTIYYTPSIGGALVDESLSDSTLRTYVDTRTGTSLRRIKHFSGYTSSFGRSCTDANDPTVVVACPDSSTTTP